MALDLVPLAAIEVGGYLSVWKIIPVLLILAFWTRMLTWIDKDAEAAYIPRDPINASFIGGAILAFALFFILPNYWICLGVVMFLLLAEIATYLIIRNKKVGLKDLRHQLRTMFTSKKKEKEHRATAGEVALINAKGAVMTPPDEESPDAAGFDGAQKILSDPLIRGAERIDMAPAEGSAQVRYQVDGVSYNASSLPLEASGAAVAYLKKLSNMDLNERRKPQKGKFKAAMEGVKHEMELNTAGSAAGEFLKIMIDPKKRHALRLEELGLTEDQMGKMQDLIHSTDGIVLVSAPKAQGLTSLLYGILRAHDAFLSHIQTIERGVEQDLEGITQNDIKPNGTPEEEAKQAAWVTSQEPDICAMTSLESPASAQSLIAYAETGRRAYVGLRAGSTFQALDIWRKLVGDDGAAVRHLKAVISGRVMRRLCNACKVGYTPDPDTVRKLNLDPAKVNKLFMPRKEPMRDPKGNPVACNFCKELKYKGRFGVFELLNVDEDVKKIVAAGGSVNQLKAVFRKQRSRFLQEMALLRITEGETSVQEMLRVLKDDGGSAAPPASGGGGGGKAAPRAPVKPAR